jgi:hypothetical protein
MKHCLVVVLLFCITGTACRSKYHNQLVPDTMKVVMWDMLKADELYNRMVLKDSTLRNSKENIRLYEEVFLLHHITKKQFDDTYKFYESNPVEYKTLLDSVESYAQRELAKATAAPGKK